MLLLIIVILTFYGEPFMKKIFTTILFALLVCLNLAGCVPTNVKATQIIDIDENPDSEFVIMLVPVENRRMVKIAWH